jgi:hypothetical protein
MVISTYNHLRSGRSTSCGCVALQKISKLNKERFPLIPIGTMLGRWEVIKNNLSKTYNSQTQRACLVRCSCVDRTEAIRTYGELRCGRSPSCGCKSKERSIETVWNDLFSKLKARGWDFHLTLPELKAIAKLPCAYCGKEPSNIYRVKYKIDGKYQRIDDPSLTIRYSGLDRIDSSLGYTYGNVVPCCGECNGMKSNHSLDQFFVLLERIRAHNPTVAGVRELAASLSVDSSDSDS